MLARLGGVVLIAAACLVLGIMAAVGRLTVSGSPTLPAGAVVPGACIGPVGSPFDHPVSAGAGEGEQAWETATYAYPIATVVDCDQPHAGEVISVDYAARAPDAATLPQLDDWDAGCQQRADSLMAGRGLTQIIDRRASGTIAWKPAMDLWGRTVGPDDAARRAGERWSACAMISNVGPWASRDPVPGQCLTTSTIADMTDLQESGGSIYTGPELQVDCSVPHPAQLVAYAAMVGGSPDDEDTMKSCVAAVTQYTGLTEADLDQGLTIEVIPASYPFCLVAASGDEELDGSLLGLGGGPVPWAG